MYTDFAVCMVYIIAVLGILQYLHNAFFISYFVQHRSYVSFSVDNNLNFSMVERLITERQSVLADLDFAILELSQGKIL